MTTLQMALGSLPKPNRQQRVGQIITLMGLLLLSAQALQWAQNHLPAPTWRALEGGLLGLIAGGVGAAACLVAAATLEPLPRCGGPEPVVVSRETGATAAVERREASVPRHGTRRASQAWIVASRKRDNRHSAPVGAPPTPLRVGREWIETNPGAATRHGNEEHCAV